MRRGGRNGLQQRDPLLVDLLVVPGRLRQKPLQPLDLAVLGAHDRLSVGQGGQGLVTVAGQQQALQVVPQAAALRQGGEQRVELLGVALQRARVGRGGGWLSVAWLLAADRIMDTTAGAYTRLNKLPVTRSRSGCCYYLDHPVTDRLTRRLIWRIVDRDGGTVTGIPTAAGTVRTPQRDRPRHGQVFEHFQGDAEAEWHRVELCGTDRVWFFRTADPARQAVPLAADDQITDPTILRQLERQA